MSDSNYSFSRRNFLSSISAALVGVVLFSFSFRDARADDSENLKIWNSLSEAEKTAVKTRWEQYKKMDTSSQAELERAMEKFEKMPEARKKEIQENFAEWQKLTPEEKEEVRKNYSQFKELPESAKAALRVRNKEWESLSEEERKKLLLDSRGTDSNVAK